MAATKHRSFRADIADEMIVSLRDDLIHISEIAEQEQQYLATKPPRAFRNFVKQEFGEHTTT